MRTIDFPAPADTLVEFLMHEETSPGVRENVRASIAEAAAALIDELGIEEAVAIEVAAYFAANLNWVRDSASKSTHGGTTAGFSMESSIISSVTNRFVHAPASNGKVSALDWLPKGTFAGDLAALDPMVWHEICQKNFIHDDLGTDFTSARIQINRDGTANVGTRGFNGAATFASLFHTLYDGGTGADVLLGMLRSPDGRHWALGGHDAGQYTIADDAVLSLTVPGAANATSPGFLLQVDTNRYSNPQPRGLIGGRVGSSVVTPFDVNLQNATNIGFSTGALTGTTGSDGNITFSGHTDKKLYIENRSGGSIKFVLDWMAQQ